MAAPGAGYRPGTHLRGRPSLLAQGSLDPAGPVAAEIAALWWWLLGLGGLVYVLVIAVLVRALARRGESPAAPGLLLVGGGVALPAVVLTAVFGLSLRSMRALPHEAEGARVIEVVGHQWWWEVRYPDAGVVTANEIHLPVGRPVELRVVSADVVHSFWVPELAGKIDALPDHANSLVLQADEPGEYRGVCAEFCGLQHAKMNLLVVAQPEAEFRAWLGGQAGLAAGEPPQVFSDAGCAMCHTIRGTAAQGEMGPDLTHVGSRRTLAANTLRNTPEHLRRWLADPQQVKEGTQMEAPDLTPAELDELVAYLGELR